MSVFGSDLGVASAFLLGAYLTADRTGFEWQVVNANLLLFRGGLDIGLLAARVETDLNLVSPTSGSYAGAGIGVQGLFGDPTAIVNGHIGLLPVAGEGFRMELRLESWLNRYDAIQIVYVSIGVHRGRRRGGGPG